MTSNEQRAALQRKIWDIANDVRGAVDGWDFKQYVLGTLFYRFISENFIDYKSFLIFGAAFILTWKFKINPILMIILAGIAGIVLYW